MTDPNTTEAEGQALSSRTTPTWEMELLVSGATAYGLLQLPAAADRLLFGLYNSSPIEVAGLVTPLWVYVKFALLTLILTFILHLCLRGYWVALAGLHSVYPRGIRWENLQKRMGPNYLATSLDMAGSMAEIVERADNRASRAFGVGFGMAAVMVMPILLVGVTLALLRLYLALGGAGGQTTINVVMGLLVLVLMPFGALVAWDRWRGEKIPEGGLHSRFLRAAFRFYGHLGFSRSGNPLLTIFASNEGGRRTGILIGVLMMGVMMVVSVQAVAERLGWDLGDFRGLPEDVVTAPDTVLPLHYASQRGDGVMLVPPPHIPDPVVRGPYLRLFVPYLPMRHNAAMEDRCPDALADTRDSGPRARLDCLAGLHAVGIDGQPLEVHFDAGEDPVNGQRGMVAMIPMQDLAPGRHELTVLPPPRLGRRKDEPLKPYRIPFWR